MPLKVKHEYASVFGDTGKGDSKKAVNEMRVNAVRSDSECLDQRQVKESVLAAEMAKTEKK
jgi:hypothetical protein